MILYIFHEKNSVVAAIYGDFCVDYVVTPKTSIGESFVENLEQMLKKNKLCLCEIENIYLKMSYSSLNASRLVTFFVKLVNVFKNIGIKVATFDSDVFVLEEELKIFLNSREQFKSINNWKELKPIYRWCTITSI